MLEYGSHETMIFKNGTFKMRIEELILEEPLSMRIEGDPYAVVMRTPGDEVNHAAGFFLSEGLVNHRDDFTTIGYCTEEGVNVARRTIAKYREAMAIPPSNERKRLA